MFVFVVKALRHYGIGNDRTSHLEVEQLKFTASESRGVD